MAEVVEATFRIVTPLFLGGANQHVDDGIRAPSIKGALRFWWRALHWGRCFREAGAETEALKLLYREERHLFGTAAVIEDQKPFGQGVFLLRVSRQPKVVLETAWPQNNTGSGYLGYGLMETKETPHRQGIREGVDFTLELRFRPATKQVDVNAMIETLHTWSLFGGLGSRVRRGFGSITLLQINNQDARLDLDGYKAAADQALHKAAGIVNFPPYTAFSEHAGFTILATGSDARQTHNQAGLRYKDHRGQSSNLRGADKIPFGLPLQGVDQDSRRASPLLFHVHTLRDDQCVAAVLYLPAVFHHEPRYQTHDLAAFNRVVAGFLSAEEPRP